MLNSHVTALAKSLLPLSLLSKLDPFEASIEKFVGSVAHETAAGALVLDAGAGECRFKPFFANANYVSVDFAQGDPKWDYSKLDLIGRLEELPFPDTSFDHVLSIVVLEHTPQPAKVIQEFRRILKRGGMVHIVVPHMWEEHQRPYDFFRFTSSGIRYLLEGNGFRIRKIHPVGGFFWLLGRSLMGVLAFTQQGWRWLLFPVLAPVFGFVLPICCYYLDSLDQDRAYTLGFICEAWKQ
ncbi:MAG: class I SAM-dependent methyltransferase [Acidobacteria bacterium]|nr:class I SAM-dependent methyltransferase [Acidobacteriota bacterium]